MEFKEHPTNCKIAHIDLQQLSKSLSKQLNKEVKFEVSTRIDNGSKICDCLFQVGEHRVIKVRGEDQTVSDGTEMFLNTQQEFIGRVIHDLILALINSGE